MIAVLFAPNCSGLLAFALGVTLTSAPKLVHQKAVQLSSGRVRFTRFPV